MNLSSGIIFFTGFFALGLFFVSRFAKLYNQCAVEIRAIEPQFSDNKVIGVLFGSFKRISTDQFEVAALESVRKRYRRSYFVLSLLGILTMSAWVFVSPRFIF